MIFKFSPFRQKSARIYFMPKMENIEKSILLRAQKGNLEAFEYILSFYEKAIYNYCLRILKDPAYAKDITQETFIKVYKNRKLIDPEKNIKTWIFTIATNTAYDFLRGRKRKNEISLDPENETISSLETYYPREGLVQDVEKALTQISPEYKNVLLLFYQQGFAYQEIADILVMPVNTVKTHLSRGKEQLKEKLKEYGKN